jgi:hypothetical protein
MQDTMGSASWTHGAYSHFYVAYSWIVKSFEVIAFGAYKDVYSKDVTSGWEAKYKAEVNSLLNAITNFEFIVVFLTVYNFLSHLEGITVKLQSSSLDIIEAFDAIDEIKALYKDLREKIDESTGPFQAVYNQAIRMAESVGVTPTMPRIARRCTTRANAPSGSIEEYYQRNIVIPFLDFIISELFYQKLCYSGVVILSSYDSAQKWMHKD